MDLAAGATVMPPGDVAEWLGRGLQSLVHRFESGRGLGWGRTCQGPAPLRVRRSPERGPRVSTLVGQVEVTPRRTDGE